MTQKSHSVTILQVAQEAGVSVATVSRYINQNAPISKDVSKRLERVMIELKYTPHAVARHLASKKTRVIGLLLANMRHDFFAPLLSGIEMITSAHKYNLLVATSHASARSQSLMPVGPHNTDGLLVFADSLSDESLESLHASGFPLVLIHRSSPKTVNIPSVVVENRTATQKLVEHLIKVHNRKRILFMHGPVHQEDSYWRETGYRSALKSNGIAFDPNLVLRGDFERGIANKSMHDFLSNSDHADFDAVFAGDDEAAIGVISALSNHGVHVPDDMSVVGFDDMPFSAYITPPLTTVSSLTEEVGRIAAEQLFSLFDKQFPENITLLSTELVIRRSCGCKT